tara:strand:- start:314 stop:547 length:234 start_codon:yes stop_codon:yes gene_type:complete
MVVATTRASPTASTPMTIWTILTRDPTTLQAEGRRVQAVGSAVDRNIKELKAVVARLRESCDILVALRQSSGRATTR